VRDSLGFDDRCPTEGATGRLTQRRPATSQDCPEKSRLRPREGSFSARGGRKGRTPASPTDLRRPSGANTDAELVERARLGDVDAFRLLVERHQQRALQLARHLVRNEHDAREVVQEALLRVHGKLAEFQGGASFYTWFYRIVANLSIDLMRRPYRHRIDLESLEDHALQWSLAPMAYSWSDTDPWEGLQRKELAGLIGKALDSLPWYHRGVIVMREIEGMSYREMAARMGVSKGTIMSRLFHARQKLQRSLDTVYLEQIEPRRGGSRNRQ